MNKICTDIPQSKRLIELGIDIKTADIYYKYVLPKSDRICHVPEIGNPIKSLEWYNKGYIISGKEPITLDEYCIPAWSLTALIDMLSDTITDEDSTVFGLNIQKNYIEYYNPSMGALYATYHSITAEDLVDAAFEMICWLKENGKL